jgi:hypothetical protein
MRAHGLRDFPDPKVSVSSSGGSQRVAVMIGGGVNKDSPRFRAAAQACRGILPAPGNNSAQDAANQRARAQYLLAFARCLRAHGVTGFPDPTAQGELRLQMVQAAGVDIHTPAFLAAGKACAGVTHGAITAAEVERAVNGSGR